MPLFSYRISLWNFVMIRKSSTGRFLEGFLLIIMKPFIHSCLQWCTRLMRLERTLWTLAPRWQTTTNFLELCRMLSNLSIPNGLAIESIQFEINEIGIRRSNAGGERHRSSMRKLPLHTVQGIIQCTKSSLPSGESSDEKCTRVQMKPLRPQAFRAILQRERATFAKEPGRMVWFGLALVSESLMRIWNGCSAIVAIIGSTSFV